MMPIIALTDLDDARAVFDALNAAYVTAEGQERDRLALLLVATHSEMTRLRTSEGTNQS